MDLILGFLSFVSIVAFLYYLLFKPRCRNLPPSPPAWPIIGHLPLFLSKNSPPFLDQVTNMAHKYGPLFLLKFGTHRVIFASTKEAAIEILKTNDKVLSGRTPLPCFLIKPHINYSLVWSDSTSYWKSLRKILHTEIFAQKMLLDQEKNRERMVGDLVNFFRAKVGDVVELKSWLFGFSLNVLSNAIFSKDVFGFSDNGGKVGMDKIIQEMFKVGGEFDAASYFSCLGRFDLHGLRRKMNELFQLAIKLWEGEVIMRKANRNAEPKDMLDVLIANDFNGHQVNALFVETFSAGSETSSSTVEWALAELTKSPDKMAKLRKELDRVVGRSFTMKESHISQLPYLQACIKETMRLHPAVPLIIPHRCMETCQAMGYTIPEGADIHVNIYAIGRDPRDWIDPLKFLPERFLDSNLDYNGNHFQFLPFSAGRRSCVGMPLAVRTIPLVLASLVHVFDWKLAEAIPVEKLDSEETFAMTMSKAQPLRLIPNIRL